jgi:hypothetical protein
LLILCLSLSRVCFKNACKTQLYSLYDFYVEAWYIPDSNENEKLRTT